METVTGTIEGKSKKGNSIRLGEDWFGTFAAKDLDHVDRGDDVVFTWEESKCGRFKNIKGKVRKASGGSSSGGTSGSKPAARGFSNTGVELGHASNLAMRMMEQCDPASASPGSAEYYKQFVQFTEEMYRLMKGMRAKVDAGEMPSGKAISKSVTPDPEVTEAEEDDDLF